MEAIGPVLKTLPFSGSLELHATPKSPLRQPAMARLKEALCSNSAGQKFDREVSLRVAVWRRRKGAIWESRLFMDAWQREMILF